MKEGEEMNGLPFEINIRCGKVTSYNNGVAKNGTPYAVFGIKGDNEDSLISCIAFDDDNVANNSHTSDKHEVYMRAKNIQKGGFYTVQGVLELSTNASGEIKPKVNVKTLYPLDCCSNDHHNKTSRPQLNGFGR